MLKYAKVIVGIPVNNLNKYYTYKVPNKLKKEIKLGQAVIVPFGRRRITAFVVGFGNEIDIETEKIKEISKIIFLEPFFDKYLLELFQWMASYYKTNLINIIKAAIPTGVVSGKVKKKTINLVKLNKSRKYIREFIKEKGNRAYKQAEVLKILLNTKKVYTSSELAEIANTSTATIRELLEKDLIKYIEKVKKRRPFLNEDIKLKKKLKATSQQSMVITEINKQICEKNHDIFLLHGVTGSGKTEVYLQVIGYALNSGFGAIVLVPEISLTPMMVKRFYSRFGDQIAVLHSNLSLGERFDEWSRLKNGEARIAIGARSAVFAPINNLGLIIIDEEHENSYKQGEYPYYHAREVAFKRSKIVGSTVVLGSATPSLESYYLAKKGVFTYLELPERINQKRLPPVKIVDMREELKNGNTTIFSLQLQQAIRNALGKKQQIIIFLNRRGYANFVLCRECGMTIRCSNCDISLTYHAKLNKLRCHYCDNTIIKPEKCPECGSKYLREFGVGTERLEEELVKLYPGAEIERMDVDTTTRKGSHYEILDRLEKGKTDILVGTQMIAKGHDYPNIGVVGVISADTMLNIPDFRSGERTFQLLTQVAGRTGRGEKDGKVIIQTYIPEHYSITSSRNHNYREFYLKEINFRKNFLYPPFSLLVNIIIKGENEKNVIKSACSLDSFLKQYNNLILQVLGPAAAAIAKIKNCYRWQVILKFDDYRKRNYVLTEIEKNFLSKNKKEVVFNIDVDPLKVI